MKAGASEEIFHQYDESRAFVLLGCLMLPAFCLSMLIFPIDVHLQVFTSSSAFRDPQRTKGKSWGPGSVGRALAKHAQSPGFRL